MDESINIDIVFAADTSVTEDELALLESILPDLLQILIVESGENQEY